jgi:2-hydroxyacyl-CoA lyase 1
MPPKFLAPPRPIACPSTVDRACETIKEAAAPLVIMGKGGLYSRAEKEAKALVEKGNLPFLATPMGKGLVSDLHPNNVAAARTFALKTADVIVLVGARLNWILHFGKAPRFNPQVKIV